jgi:hypothetical protein
MDWWYNGGERGEIKFAAKSGYSLGSKTLAFNLSRQFEGV